MTTRMSTCACGGLRATCEGEPIRVSVCHCHACQRRTGSVFGVAARFAPEQVSIEGDSSEHVRIGDEGDKIVFRFCPTCGSTVCWQQPDHPGSIAIAVGGFADPGFAPHPSRSVYDASRRHAWVEFTVPVERLG